MYVNLKMNQIVLSYAYSLETKFLYLQLWTEHLLKMAYNLLALNAPATMYLEKAHTKVQLLTDRDGKVPVKK